MHATTDAVPAVRLEEERPALRPVPPPYRGLVTCVAAPWPIPEPRPIVGLQHPLAIYDTLFVRAVPGLPEAAA